MSVLEYKLALTFGELVETRLNEVNISRRELARRAEVDVAYISKIINSTFAH